MENKNFEDYGFKPSAVIEGLNRWYDAGGKHSLIRFADPDGRPDHYHFYDHNNVIDAAIKYLRSMDIFYQPGLKWDDVKFKISTEACNAEYGYPDIRSAWPKVNPIPLDYADFYDFTKQKKKFDQWKTERDRAARDKEIWDYILKLAEEKGINLHAIRDKSLEELIYYLISLLVRNRNNAKVERERADGYLEKIDRLQKELDSWDCWYNDKENYVK